MKREKRVIRLVGVKRGDESDEAGMLSNSLVTENTSSVLEKEKGVETSGEDKMNSKYQFKKAWPNM